MQPDIAVRAEAAKDTAYLLALLDLREGQDMPLFVKQQIDDSIQRLLSRLATAEAKALRNRIAWATES